MSAKNTFLTGALCLILNVGYAARAGDAAGDKVRTQRVPAGGIQPQVAVDGKGVVHLIYFRGQAGAGDVFYVHSTDAGRTFSRPLQVNRHPGSAIAVGNIRGAHLAVGKNGRIHVAWMGSDKARPRALDNATPMLYTRLNDAGDAFEPERNVLQSAAGLDGGGSVAADEKGHVCVVWHAPEPGVRGEDKRRVWIARSDDEGKTFAPEKPAFAEPTGACGCCGMRALADEQGEIYVLYRSAKEQVHRDIYLLTSGDHGADFQGVDLHPWQISTCPMSSMALTRSAAGVLAAWETDGQVYWTRIEPATGKRAPPVSAPGSTGKRKHPVVAANKEGETILGWTEGMDWNQGGSLAWQVFDKQGKPTAERGSARGVPVWSLVAVFARPDGGFTILY